MRNLTTLEMEHTQELLDIVHRLETELYGLHFCASREAQTLHLTRAIQRHRALGELLAKAAG